MALFDSLKKATGVGLSPAQVFERAYEKGVLLGPAEYPKAIEYFVQAAEQAAQKGDTRTLHRAKANEGLYRFVLTRELAHLLRAQESLEYIDEIERVGTQNEFMNAHALRAEIAARALESRAFGLSLAGPGARAVAHGEAAEAFRGLLSETLVTYRIHAPDELEATGMARFMLHQGLQHSYTAQEVVSSDPEAAAEKLSLAVAAFRQCDAARAAEAEGHLARVRQRRTCWICHREFQGASVHFRSHDVRVHPYVERVIDALGQDRSSVSSELSRAVICHTCEGLLLAVVSDSMNAVAHRYDRQIAAMEAAIRNLRSAR